MYEFVRVSVVHCTLVYIYIYIYICMCVNIYILTYSAFVCITECTVYEGTDMIIIKIVWGIRELVLVLCWFLFTAKR